MRKQNSPLFVILGLVACLTPLSTRTQAAAARDYRPLAREIFRELIEIKTTDSGVGSTPAAEAVAQRLRHSHGRRRYRASDRTCPGRVSDTAWRGR